MKIVQVILISLLSCIVSTDLIAGNYSFLKDSAISYFTDTDTNMMSANIQNTLNNTPNGKKSVWKNSTTHAWGYAIPSQAQKRNGAICRHLNVFNEANNRSGVSNFVFCKINGAWKIP